VEQHALTAELRGQVCEDCLQPPVERADSDDDDDGNQTDEQAALDSSPPRSLPRTSKRCPTGTATAIANPIAWARANRT
jgi:hypothetical protein